jgi:hypothetical protein
MDRQKVEILQLRHSNKTINKLNESLKHQNEELKKEIESIKIGKDPALNLMPLPQENSLDFSKSNIKKLHIDNYIGEGIEGCGYY